MRCHSVRSSSTVVFCSPVCTPNVKLIRRRTIALRVPARLDRAVKAGRTCAMPTARANGIELWYETIGDPDGVPLLLVSGLGSQGVTWADDFCNLFVPEGFYVIRFDNRDVGLSTKIESPHLNFGEE